MDSSHHSQVSEAHGSVCGYVTGFVLAVVLTAASFSLVQRHILPPQTSLLALAALALAQIVVHLVFFLHMNTSSQQRWVVMAFGFTVLIAVILISGSLWIMHNVSINMMSR